MHALPSQVRAARHPSPLGRRCSRPSWSCSCGRHPPLGSAASSTTSPTRATYSSSRSPLGSCVRSCAFSGWERTRPPRPRRCTRVIAPNSPVGAGPRAPPSCGRSTRPRECPTGRYSRRPIASSASGRGRPPRSARPSRPIYATCSRRIRTPAGRWPSGNSAVPATWAGGVSRANPSTSSISATRCPNRSGNPPAPERRSSRTAPPSIASSSNGTA